MGGPAATESNQPQRLTQTAKVARRFAVASRFRTRPTAQAYIRCCYTTVMFVASNAEAGFVRDRIESVLRSGAEWQLVRRTEFASRRPDEHVGLAVGVAGDERRGVRRKRDRRAASGYVALGASKRRGWCTSAHLQSRAP